MTRAVFAFITDDPYDIHGARMLVSEQYNGDMGPAMNKGLRYGGAFVRNIQTKEQFEQFCLRVSRDYGYTTVFEDGKKVEDYAKERIADNLIEGGDATHDNPFVVYEKKYDKDGTRDYLSGPYSRIFHFSDYVYMKNMSSHALFFKDADKQVFCLAPGQCKILNFGSQLPLDEWKEFCLEITKDPSESDDEDEDDSNDEAEKKPEPICEKSERPVENKVVSEFVQPKDKAEYGWDDIMLVLGQFEIGVTPGHGPREGIRRTVRKREFDEFVGNILRLPNFSSRKTYATAFVNKYFR